ncbi:MAG TPA: NRDE family protein [Flavilitoribacter sp.]|nr:NRDE family protein [Flavilitoribacter sp.]HMQ89362.1 NRDE family protein [Flavilitoribacter sp.]
MCTVTFLPRENGNFVLTSNRDEAPKRSPQSLSTTFRSGQELLFPKDTRAGGTWIAASSDNRLVCVLNGAFEKHAHQPPYRRSRGLMALDFFDYANPADFAREYHWEGIEPFTLIVWDRGQLWEIRWDEKKLHQLELKADQPHIWSSATLYPAPIQAKRREWFAGWLKGRTDFPKDAVLDFHRNTGDGDPWNDLVMDRNGKVCTVSITCVEKTRKTFAMDYADLVHDSASLAEIELSREVVAAS